MVRTEGREVFTVSWVIVVLVLKMVALGVTVGEVAALKLMVV